MSKKYRYVTFSQLKHRKIFLAFRNFNWFVTEMSYYYLGNKEWNAHG